MMFLAKNQQLSNGMPMESTVADAPTRATDFYSAFSVVNKPNSNSQQLPQW